MIFTQVVEVTTKHADVEDEGPPPGQEPRPSTSGSAQTAIQASKGTESTDVGKDTGFVYDFIYL